MYVCTCGGRLALSLFIRCSHLCKHIQVKSLQVPGPSTKSWRYISFQSICVLEAAASIPGETTGCSVKNQHKT